MVNQFNLASSDEEQSQPGGTVKLCDLASLCTNCLQIFRGHHSFGHQSVLIASSATNLIKPQRCRVCSIIWSRHERFVETNKRQGKTLNLFQVLYFLQSRDIAKLEGVTLSLTLELYYTNGGNGGNEFMGITLAMISADSKHP